MGAEKLDLTLERLTHQAVSSFRSFSVLLFLSYVLRQTYSHAVSVVHHAYGAFNISLSIASTDADRCGFGEQTSAVWTVRGRSLSSPADTPRATSGSCVSGS